MNVLVIDDHAELVRKIQRFLNAQGISTEIALSGRQALEQCRENDYDVVVLDLYLPDMDGSEAFKHMRAMAGPGVPFIIMTGDTERVEAIQGLVSERDDLILKPFHFDELLARLSNLLLACHL